MSKQVEAILTLARNEIGTKENPPNSNNVKYNTWYYGRQVSGSAYPWCACWVNWVFYHSGLAHLYFGGQKTASCTTYMNWAIAESKKGNGQWITDVKKMPVGSVVLFNWNNGKPKTTAQHIGICSAVWNGQSLSTIEGNTSVTSNDNGGSVMERSRNASVILGAYMPKYDGAVPTPTPQPTPQPTPSVPPTIRKGSQGQDVRNAQGLLNDKGASPKLVIDGIFGTKTDTATREFQKANKLVVDGIIGRNTWTALLK